MIPAIWPVKGLGAIVGIERNSQVWTIKEQIIEDLATGLTLQFEVIPGDFEAPFRLKIVGDFPFGNREIRFGRDGQEASSAVALAGLCSPTWLTSADEYPATD
jgi:hypothetical protein